MRSEAVLLRPVRATTTNNNTTVQICSRLFIDTIGVTPVRGSNDCGDAGVSTRSGVLLLKMAVRGSRCDRRRFHYCGGFVKPSWSHLEIGAGDVSSALADAADRGCLPQLVGNVVLMQCSICWKYQESSSLKAE